MKPRVGQAFRRFTRAAAATAADPQQVRALLERAVAKSEKRRGAIGEVWEELRAFFRLLRAWASGRYTQVPWRTIVLLVAAIAYFVSPFDAVPDWIVGLGFIDDIYIVRLVVRATRRDLARYRAWEQAEPQPLAG